MATIIEVQDSKLEHLSEYAEKVIRYGEKLMDCVEELSSKSKYSEYPGHERKHRERERYDEDRYPSRYY